MKGETIMSNVEKLTVLIQKELWYNPLFVNDSVKQPLSGYFKFSVVIATNN